MTDAEQPSTTQNGSAKPQRPRYGELADPANQPQKRPQSKRASTSPRTSAAAPQARQASNDTGIPHNLGVGVKRSDAATSVTPAAQRPSSDSSGAGAPSAPGHTTAPRRNSDRIATVLLLGFGALTALNVAQAFMALNDSFAILYATFDLGSFDPPSWFSTVSTVGWISQLAVFAVVLIASIQRMQRGKIAFWLPLVGALVSFALTFVILAVALTGAPELVQYIQTNGVNLDEFTQSTQQEA